VDSKSTEMKETPEPKGDEEGEGKVLTYNERMI